MTVNPIETLLFTPHPRSKRAEVSLPFFALFDGLAEGEGGAPLLRGNIAEGLGHYGLNRWGKARIGAEVLLPKNKIYEDEAEDRSKRKDI